MKHVAAAILMGLAFAGVGLAGGWFAARQTSSGGGEKAAGHGKEPGHEGHAHEDGDHLDISEQALKNLGVTFVEAAPVDFSRNVGIPAVVVAPVGSEIPVTAPVSGRVLEIRVPEGSVVAAGAVVATLLRDPIAPPELVVTAEIFQPAGEQLHQAVGELRKARRNLDLLNTELERLQKFAESGTEGGYPIVPRKNLIDLKYEISRAEKELANAHSEMHRHGLSEEQIAEIESGHPTPFLGQRLWKKALEQNGLWPAEAEALSKALPDDLREAPRVIATIGELAATGLANPALVAWLKDNADAGRDFLHVAALLQRGSTLREVQFLQQAGGLSPVVEVRAPQGGAPDFDVRVLLVKPGEHVEAGARLAVLDDARVLHLGAEAAGGDATRLIAALTEGATLEARPLVDGTGPVLKGLSILFARNDEADSGTVATLRIPNEELVSRELEKARFRTWKLRPGLRYMLQVPVHTWKGVYVVPSDAVVEDGLERIVFLKDGDGVKPAKVVVVWQDQEVAVLDGKSSQLFPDDEVAQHGAFALRLALRAGSGEPAGAHAGHNH
jgi:multidrug efflux pump subunit AcrA (membrane-fusion protein)